MPVIPLPPQELLFVTLTGNSTTTNNTTHGAAPSPTIGGNFVTTTGHPNVDIIFYIGYYSASVVTVPTVHVMVDGVAAGNCKGEAYTAVLSAGVGGSVTLTCRVSGLTAGGHSVSIQLSMNGATGTATANGSANNPMYLRVVEAP